MPHLRSIPDSRSICLHRNRNSPKSPVPFKCGGMPKADCGLVVQLLILIFIQAMSRTTKLSFWKTPTGMERRIAVLFCGRCSDPAFIWVGWWRGLCFRGTIPGVF